ncbi:MAG TPA: adenylate kinase [Terriglobales bacterium]|nr:adenylate kinase [Terriglobales bacterium]
MDAQTALSPSVDSKTKFVGTLVLLGAPGAGKGTQAKAICARYGIPQMSTGDLLRDNIARRTELGAKAKVFMDHGELVPDQLVEDMLAARVVGGADTDRGFILDGFPRTLPQAEWLDGFLDEWTAQHGEGRSYRPVVINVVVSYNELLRRLTGRRSCPTCGRIYNVYLQPPRVADVCDVDGSKLVTRPDDSEEVISERLRVYERQTLPLTDYYRAQGRLHEIDGDRDAATVAADILNLIEHGDRL